MKIDTIELYGRKPVSQFLTEVATIPRLVSKVRRLPHGK